MKKSIKISLIVIGIIVLCFIIDLICIFTINRPLFAIKEDNGDSVNLIYRGLFYDTYNCHEFSAPQIKVKGAKYTCAGIKFDEEKVTLSKLRNIRQKVSDGLNNVVTDNVASVGIDEVKRVVIIELIDNSDEQQKWFRENIYDSKYIVFKQGGPYTTSNDGSIKPNLFDRREIIKVAIDNYSQYENYFEYSDKDIIDKIYNLFKDLKTNVKSKSNEPENPDELYTVTFFNDENMLIQSDNDIFKAIVHVYRKGNKYYAEEQKNGIYEITEDAFNVIKNLVK